MKSPSEHERPLTPEIGQEAVVHLEPEAIEHTTEVQLESRPEAAETTDHEPVPIIIEAVDIQPAEVEHKTRAHLEPRSAVIEPVDVQSEVPEHHTHVHLEPRPATIEPIHVQSEVIEHKNQIHLEPRPATIESVHVQPEKTPIVIPSKKTEHTKASKKLAIDLHGAAVDLPPVELVEPGPLPTLPIVKGKKSAAGLCASCFGAKAAEKKKRKKGATSAPIPAPAERKKSTGEEKKQQPSPVTEAPPVLFARSDEPILPRVNIDTFKERNFQNSYEVKCQRIRME